MIEAGQYWQDETGAIHGPLADADGGTFYDPCSGHVWLADGYSRTGDFELNLVKRVYVTETDPADLQAKIDAALVKILLLEDVIAIGSRNSCGYVEQIAEQQAQLDAAQAQIAAGDGIMRVLLEHLHLDGDDFPDGITADDVKQALEDDRQGAIASVPTPNQLQAKAIAEAESMKRHYDEKIAACMTRKDEQIAALREALVEAREWIKIHAGLPESEHLSAMLADTAAAAQAYTDRVWNEAIDVAVINIEMITEPLSSWSNGGFDNGRDAAVTAIEKLKRERGQ